MSFVLPGNARTLRFTGETKAFDPNVEEAEPPPSARSEVPLLGRPRERRPVQTPRRVEPPAPDPRPAARRVLTPVESYHPYVGSLLGPALRQKSDDEDDATVEGFYDNPTTAMSRDALVDVLPGARALLAPKAPATVAAPIPHFRPVNTQPLQPTVPRTAIKTVKTRAPSRAPLAVWILAAVIVGGISFRFAPDVVARIDPRVVGPQR